MQSECAFSEEMYDLLPWYTLLHQNSPFSWLWKYQWSSSSTLFLLSSTWLWSNQFILLPFPSPFLIAGSLISLSMGAGELKRITLGKRSVNKGRVEEGVEKILPTSGYRFELLTHSDSPPNKYMTLTLLFFWSWVGDFLIGMYFFPLT